MVPEVELGVRLTHSDDALDVSDGDRDSTNDVGLSSDVSVELSDLVLVDLGELWLLEPLGVDEVLLQGLLRDQIILVLPVSLHDVVG